LKPLGSFSRSLSKVSFHWETEGNSEDASDAIHRKASALAGLKATKRALIVDFQ
jgi:hypothetical protein